MPTTFSKLATVQGNGSSGTLTFSSIPGTYTDFKILLSGQFNTTNGYYGDAVVNINGGSISGGWVVWGNGSVNGSSSSTNVANVSTKGNNANNYTVMELYFSNYATSLPKIFSVDSVTEGNNADEAATIYAGWLNDSAAITSVSISGIYGWSTGTTATLYLIKKD